MRTLPARIPASHTRSLTLSLLRQYDCGTANQIWSNCADVELVVGPVPTPDPSATVAPTQPPATAPTTAKQELGMCQNCAVGSSGPCKGGASGTGCWSYSDPINKLCPPGTAPCFKAGTDTATNAPVTAKGVGRRSTHASTSTGRSEHN